MKNLTNPLTSADYPLPTQGKASWLARTLYLALAFVAVFSLPQAWAQTTIKPFQLRVEAAAGAVTTITLTNNIMRLATNGASVTDGTGTNWIIPSVNASITGAPGGVTASLTDSSGNALGAWPINLNTNNASATTNIYVKLVFDGTQVGGISTLGINMTGGITNGYFPLVLEIGRVWNGSANAALNGPGNWSDSSKWGGGGVPGANDSVVFLDAGAQTNSLLAGASYLTNSVVDASTTISALRFGMTNGLSTLSTTTNFHNLYIKDGVNLAITGVGGFSMLRDYTYQSLRMNVAIYGTNGTLIQTNDASNFSMLIDGQGSIPNSILDMSGLGRLQLGVNRVAIGDILAYPNYNNLITNLYNPGSTFGSSRPSKCLPSWKMAMTNVVRAVYVDPNGYNSALSRSYAMEIGRNEVTGGSSGNYGVSMGLSNSFALDGLCVAGYASLGGVLNFTVTNSYAIFRNTNGGRMSVIAMGDAAGSSSTLALGNNTKCGNVGLGVDFTRSTVDILVDRLFMSMDRGYTTGGGVCQSSMGMSAGVLDANSAFIGYQASGNQTNQNNCTASLTVSNTAIFRVNKTLAIGYTTATAGDPSLPGSTKGTITIGPGGTLMASNITVGGTTKASAGNSISMIGNATLVVSNAIADASANGALGTLNFSGNNDAIKVFLNGAVAGAKIYVTNFTASGTGNKLIIGGATNLTYPADVIIVQGAGAVAVSSASFDAGVVMPAGSGLSGSLSTDAGNNRIMLHIINRAPNSLVWRGSGSTADWDYTTTNWVNTANGGLTNYDNPDTVAFDGVSSSATNINIAGDPATPLTPTAVNMTNNSVNYVFLNGPNQINGGPSLNKFGSGSVEIDGATTFNVQLNQGKLIGMAPGSVGNVNVASGTVMNYSGNLGGSLAVLGTATVGGTVSGTLTVQSGGFITNTGTINNPISIQTNGVLYNFGTLANIGVGSSGSPQVAKGGTLINDGVIGAISVGSVLFVSGTFEDLGDLSDTMTLQSVTVANGGTFLPGVSTALTVINSDGTGSFPGAALLQQGSTTVLMVNAAALTNTVLRVNNLSFGGSSNQRNQNGCTLLISNISVTPFSVGQSFHLFDNLTSPGSVPYNTGTSTNTYPVIIPASPGSGLVWDMTQLWVSGNIGVVGQGSGPVLTNSFSFQGSSNIVAHFSWDASNLGYRLQSLTGPLTVGLSGTNWGNIAGSWTNTAVTLTNSIGTDCVFYRLVYP